MADLGYADPRIWGYRLDFGDIGDTLAGGVTGFMDKRAIKKAWDASGGDYQKAAELLLAAGDKRNAAAILELQNTADGGGDFGLNPVLMEDQANPGQYKYFQTNRGGGMTPIDTPGYTPAPPNRWFEGPNGPFAVPARGSGAMPTQAGGGQPQTLRQQKQEHELAEQKATDQALSSSAITKFDEQIANFQSLVNPDGTASQGLRSITGNREVGGVDTGIPNAWLKDVSQESRNASANLKTSAIQVGLTTLENMRAMSAQGASGMGQLAIQESIWLQNSIRSLQETQDPVQMAKHIQDVINNSRKAQARIRNKYREIYGEDLPVEAAPQGGDVNNDGIIDASDYFR